jgi:hypothetical protein
LNGCKMEIDWVDVEKQKAIQNEEAQLSFAVDQDDHSVRTRVCDSPAQEGEEEEEEEVIAQDVS